MHISQQIAAAAVNQVLSGSNLTLALPKAMKKFKEVSPQQRGGAMDLSYGTLRFYGEVDAYLKQLLEKPLSDEGIRCLLLVAIYQLLHDKADSFTVVNQAVNAAGYAKPRWAKGLVNGVLRNFLRKQEALTDKIKNLEVAKYSYPQWWINKLKKDYPKHWQAILAVGNMHPPMTLRVNTKKISMADYLDSLKAHEILAEQVGEQAVILDVPMSVEKVPLFTEGLVSIQDYGAQLVAPLLDAQANMRVLDACAAPGGKTGHILELADVKLTAIDREETRIARIESNMQRLNLQATLKVGDAAKPDSWWDGKLYDRILADVPCTASGIVRRHVDIKWLRREADIASFTQQQTEILQSLWHLLSKGGKLLYVTCSIFFEENQQQIDHFIQKNADATQLPILLTNSSREKINISDGQLNPSNIHDGFFYALLQKN